MQIRKGDIFYADLSPVIGCEQGGIRPVLIVQNNTGNKYSPTVIVAAITGRQVQASSAHSCGFVSRQRASVRIGRTAGTDTDH